jgi:hypothetical protein
MFRIFKILIVLSFLFVLVPYWGTNFPFVVLMFHFLTSGDSIDVLFVCIFSVFAASNLYLLITGVRGRNSKFDDIITVVLILVFYYYLAMLQFTFVKYGDIWVWVMLSLFITVSLPLLIMSVTRFIKRLN